MRSQDNADSGCKGFRQRKSRSGSNHHCPKGMLFIPAISNNVRPARGPIRLYRCLVHACAHPKRLITSVYINSNAATVTTVGARHHFMYFRATPTFCTTTDRHVHTTRTTGDSNRGKIWLSDDVLSFAPVPLNTAQLEGCETQQGVVVPL